jgi:hypothetical protein
MDLLKRFKRTVKDQSHQSRTSNNNNHNDPSLGGGCQWKYPARLYYPIGDTRDDSDSSDNSNSSADISTGTGAGDTSIDSHKDDDADDEASAQSFEALQFEASIEASACSVLVGELAFANMSMVYSEDGENSTTSSAVSNISALSSQHSLDGTMENTSTGFMKKETATPTPNQSSSSAAAYDNANASGLNMLQLQDRHESDDESLLSEASSIFSPDRYFQPQEEVAHANLVSDNDSNEEETTDDYIFTDDKSDPPSPPVQRLTVAESAELAKSCSLIQPEQEEEKKEVDQCDLMPPETWSYYNSARGRKAAKVLTPADAEDEDKTMQTPKTRSHHNHRRPSSHRTDSTDKRSSSMLGRAVQSLRRKRYTPSSSPLDYQHPPKAKKQEDLAVSKSLLLSSSSSTSQKAVTLSDPAMSPSAVYARNALVDFGSWEARASRLTITTASAAATTTAIPTTCTTAKAKRSPLTVRIPEEEGQDSFVKPSTGVTPTGETKAFNFAVKVTSLFSAGMPSPPQVSHENNELDYSALESPRTLADDMLQSLGLAGDDHARQCLQTLRARAGVIDDLECDQQDADEDPSNVLPWMHIVDDIWMPHYEEYVFTTVRAFHRRLLGPSVEGAVQ